MRFAVDGLRRFCSKVLTEAGLDPGDADICADCLVTADLRGVHSHGVTHLSDLVGRIDAGTIRTSPDIRISRTAPGSILVDAGQGAGMVAGVRAMNACMDAAAEAGIAVAVIHNTNTYGLGAYYPMLAAKRGMIGFAMSNTKAYVAPGGGADPKLGTNPLSMAIPCGRYPDLVVDMATSQAAVNKIALAMKEGRSIPPDWAVGPDGARTTDPAEAYKGALLSFGGYKGYAIQLMISVLAHALAGGALDTEIPKAWVEYGESCNFGCLMGAVDISKFRPPEEFRAGVDEVLDMVKSARPAEGSDGVMLPGERSYAAMERNRRDGIAVSDAVGEELRNLGARFGIPLPR